MEDEVPAALNPHLAAFFARKIIGQPNAAERIIPFIQTHRAGLNHPNRPVGVFLLLGPTGTGKTRTVEVLAEALHGSPQRYLRVDCGEFQLDHEVAKLIGAPPGYLGHRETVPLLSAQKLTAITTPACNLSLVLIDEIEKAAPSLGRLLLGVLDKGRLTLGDNTVVNFDNSLIFLTSNLGGREMMREMAPAYGFDPGEKPENHWAELSNKLETVALSAMRKLFSPEFINRIDAVITYQPLTAESIGRILDNEIEELREHVNSRLGQRCFAIELGASSREFLLTRGVSVEYGARELKRAVYRYLTQPLATLVAENRVPAGCSVIVFAIPGKSSLDFEMRPAGLPVAGVARPAVLLVDDNRALLKFLKTALGQQGWDLAAATSAHSALQLAEKRNFDIALIDYMLPHVDGVALGIKLRALRPSLEIVLMTGGGVMAFPQDSAFAEVPVIQKPFVIDDLLKLLRSRLPENARDRPAPAPPAQANASHS